MSKVKLLLIVVVSAATLMALSSVASANVIRDASGNPIIVYSNPGSVQGQLNRSPQGDLMKTTHDGWSTIGPLVQ